jgi:hypothetical protein
MISIVPARSNDSTNERRGATISGRAYQAAQRVFGREREYASRKEYAERVITVSVANAYRLGPWV